MTGVRQHKPVTFTKVVDRCSPQLWDALCHGEQITFELKFYRTTSGGMREHYYTTKSEQCVIVDGKSYDPLALLPENNAIAHIQGSFFRLQEGDVGTHGCRRQRQQRLERRLISSAGRSSP